MEVYIHQLVIVQVRGTSSMLKWIILKVLNLNKEMISLNDKSTDDPTKRGKTLKRTL